MLKKVLILAFCCSSHIALANCGTPTSISHQKLYLWNNMYLGEYDINFNIALCDIKRLDLPAPQDPQKIGPAPYYPRRWLGACPNGLGVRNECLEYTVYPGTLFFKPSLPSEPNDIMDVIIKTIGRTNRGPVRIITNKSKTEYVYTVDHERVFCGPYHL
jgi:hypothetical protein